MRKLMLAVCLVGALGVFRSSPSAQQGDNVTFEVATIKVNKSGERGGGFRRLPGGRVTVTNMPARMLVIFAYDLTQFQIAGGPAWITSDRFDIVAKMEGNPEWGGPGTGRTDPIKLAMRTLLAERFKLKLHRESRETDVYALMVVKPGTL